MKSLLNRVFNRTKLIWYWIVPLALIILVCSEFALPANATGVYQMPTITAASSDTWVIDKGDVISRFNENKISTALADVAQKTGNELRIVTIRRFDYGETPETFGKALFQKWFPTVEAQANQALLVLDTITNGTVIITGDKVKAQLNDKIATSIAEETVQVPLREGNKYNQAFLDASDRLVAVLSGQPDPGPPQIKETVQVEGTFTKAEDTTKNKGNSTAWVVGLLIAATVIPMATYYLYQVFQS
ncbi:MAG: TPM domain-containing protein [Nostocaceae cyanobacterium]|nr:TPM domain-containing protein [Nostocaceae cyanobacterium]